MQIKQVSLSVDDRKTKIHVLNKEGEIMTENDETSAVKNPAYIYAISDKVMGLR